MNKFERDLESVHNERAPGDSTPHLAGTSERRVQPARGSSTHTAGAVWCAPYISSMHLRTQPLGFDMCVPHLPSRAAIHTQVFAVIASFCSATQTCIATSSSRRHASELSSSTPPWRPCRVEGMPRLSCSTPQLSCSTCFRHEQPLSRVL